MLYLQSLPKSSLQRTSVIDLSIDNLRSVGDLEALSTAATLRRLWLISMAHLRPADLTPLLRLPQLEGVVAGRSGQ